MGNRNASMHLRVRHGLALFFAGVMALPLAAQPCSQQRLGIFPQSISSTCHLAQGNAHGRSYSLHGLIVSDAFAGPPPIGEGEEEAPEEVPVPEIEGYLPLLLAGMAYMGMRARRRNSPR